MRVLHVERYLLCVFGVASLLAQDAVFRRHLVRTATCGVAQPPPPPLHDASERALNSRRTKATTSRAERRGLLSSSSFPPTLLAAATAIRHTADEAPRWWELARYYESATRAFPVAKSIPTRPLHFWLGRPASRAHGFISFPYLSTNGYKFFSSKILSLSLSLMLRTRSNKSDVPRGHRIFAVVKSDSPVRE